MVRGRREWRELDWSRMVILPSRPRHSSFNLGTSALSVRRREVVPHRPPDLLGRGLEAHARQAGQEEARQEQGMRRDWREEKGGRGGERR
eukprot:210267-Hanusia_phi.AAC.1